MAERRSLMAGIKLGEGVDPQKAREFIYGPKAEDSKPAAAAPAVEDRKRPNSATVHRVPLTTRIREDFATLLTRVSLERQLKGEFPNTKLDILEEALEPWFRTHGYLK